MRCRQVVVSIVGLLAAHAAQAQQVRGRVVDSATATPIAGAVASLLDSAGRVLGRTITDQNGRFRLAAAVGAKRLQLLRIGYRPRDERLPSSAAGDIEIETRMSPVPKFLESVRVSDRAMCPGSDAGADALALWEQARAGLLATVVARDARPASVRSIIYERRIDMPGWKVVSQTTSKKEGISSRPFVAARPAAAFAAAGFMIEDGGDRHYSAPDADVMLDPSFIATHCVRVFLDQAHPGQVGLGFQPAPGRDTLVDVAGVLWLDRAVPALRALEFRFTGLEPAATPAAAGGSLLFRTMPNGVVFIERWKILMPLFTQIRTAGYSPPPTRFRTDRRNLVVNRMIEGGGELMSAAWPDARWDASLGRLGGVVVERGSGKPIANIRVWLENTGDSTTTDSAGAFLLTGLLPGPYRLRATDTTLAEFGLSQSKEIAVDVGRELLTAKIVQWEPLNDRLKGRCRGQDMPENTTAILGRAYLPGGAPARAGAVGAAWKDIVAARSEFVALRDRDRQSVIDDAGRFHLCGVPRERLVRIRAMSGDGLMKDTTMVIPPDSAFGFLTVKLEPVGPRRP